MPLKRVTAKTVSIPASTGGWNARDSLAAMDPADAPTLINMVPYPSEVRIRNGWSNFRTLPSGGNVYSIMNYAGGATERLFAVNSAGIWDCTPAVPVLAPVTISSSSLIEFVNISTAGGNFLVVVNGADPMLLFNGTNWIKMGTPNAAVTVSSITVVGTTATMTTATGHGLVTSNQITISGATPAALNNSWIVTVLTPTTLTFTVPAATASASVVGTYSILQITGVASNTFAHVNLFKQRLWFCQAGGLNAAYLGTSAIAGVATQFSLGGFFRRGGFLQASGTWTLDAGEGVDDYLAFATSRGEVLIYKGTDPSVATSFTMQGLWQLGPVFTRRCFHKWGGDLLLLSHDGLVPLSGALQSSRLDPKVSVTNKISQAISTAVSDYQFNFGWQIFYYGDWNLLIINVPVLGASEQYVMHTNSKQWCRFTGINLYCMVEYQNKVYFGANGYVGLLYEGNSDNGSNINATVQQAFGYFGNAGQIKRFTLMRPTFLTDQSTPGVNIGLNYDYQITNQLSPPSFNPSLSTVAIWDTATWDNGKWGSGEFTVSSFWKDVTGIGTSAGIAMTIATQGGNLRWVSTDVSFEAGAVL